MAVELRELQERRRLRRRRRYIRRLAAILVLAATIAGSVITARLVISHGKKVRLDALQEEIPLLDWVEVDLLPVNAYSRPGTPVKQVNAIVVHYVGNPGTAAWQNRKYFAGLADSGETRASSNFIIGLEGEILQCVPVNEVAYCSNWRNGDTISVECCHQDDTGQFNDATYASLVRLTAWLCYKLDLKSSDVIRHYDVSGKKCPRYFVDNEDAWEDFKEEVQSALNELGVDGAV